MKNTLIIVAFILLFSAPAFSQTLKLEISNPQPRLGETFKISINIDSLNNHVFTTLGNQLKLSSNTEYCTQPSMNINAEATKTGEYEIGPLKLNFNGVDYHTDKIKFAVIDSLPAVNEGVWIRKVPVNDSTFIIMIDQRIPALNYITRSGNSISSSLQSNDDDKLVELTNEEIENIKNDHSNSGTEMRTIYLPGHEVSFKNSYKVYYLTIKDKTKKIRLTKNSFLNLPPYYKFQDIILN